MSAYKGWKGEIRYADTEADLASASAITGVQSIDGPNFDSDSETIHALGSKTPYAVADGTIEITFSVERVLSTSDDLTEFYNIFINGDEKYWGIYPQGYDTGNPKIVIVGKITSYSLSGIEPGGTVTESFDVTGKSVTIGTI